MLVGLAAGTEQGVQGVLFYLAVYVAMTLGSFALILGMRTKNGMVETIDDLSGLSRTHPFRAYVFALMMFSLAGIPPFAGFFAKFYVFLAAIEAQLYLLAVIGVVTSVVGAFYYIRIVKVMFFDEPKAPFERLPAELTAVVILTGLFVIVFGLVPAPIANAASAAARSLF
jgi:NADH-quinone oxidoreductase subunit N